MTLKDVEDIRVKMQQDFDLVGLLDGRQYNADIKNVSR